MTSSSTKLSSNFGYIECLYGIYNCQNLSFTKIGGKSSEYRGEASRFDEKKVYKFYDEK